MKSALVIAMFLMACAKAADPAKTSAQDAAEVPLAAEVTATDAAADVMLAVDASLSVDASAVQAAMDATAQ